MRENGTGGGRSTVLAGTIDGSMDRSIFRQQPGSLSYTPRNLIYHTTFRKSPSHDSSPVASIHPFIHSSVPTDNIIMRHRRRLCRHVTDIDRAWKIRATIAAPPLCVRSRMSRTPGTHKRYHTVGTSLCGSHVRSTQRLSISTSCSGEGTMGDTSNGTVPSLFLNILHQVGHRNSIGL